MIEVSIRDELIQIRVLLELLLGEMESMSQAMVVARTGQTLSPPSDTDELQASLEGFALA